MRAAPCSTSSTKWHVPSISSDFRAKLAFFSENRNCDYYAADSCHARLFRTVRRTVRKVRHEGSSANVSFGEYEDARGFPLTAWSLPCCQEKASHDDKMRMQDQSVAVIESTCAFSRQVLLAGGGLFCRRRKMEATISRIAIESTPHRSVAGQPTWWSQRGRCR